VVNNYPDFYQQVMDTMAGFMQLHKASSTDGALSAKVKELIALAIGVVVRCDGCISFHIHDAIRAGATRDEIVDTIGVAIMMGGGPAVVYGSQALEALAQFESNGES
jgi:AhpD family alkylhydroperoxidase